MGLGHVFVSEGDAQGEEMGEQLATGGVVDRGEGDLLEPPLIDERVLFEFPVARAASSISWRSVVPEREMSNWW